MLISVIKTPNALNNTSHTHHFGVKGKPSGYVGGLGKNHESQAKAALRKARQGEQGTPAPACGRTAQTPGLEADLPRVTHIPITKGLVPNISDIFIYFMGYRVGLGRLWVWAYYSGIWSALLGYAMWKVWDLGCEADCFAFELSSSRGGASIQLTRQASGYRTNCA